MLMNKNPWINYANILIKAGNYNGLSSEINEIQEMQIKWFNVKKNIEALKGKVEILIKKETEWQI